MGGLRVCRCAMPRATEVAMDRCSLGSRSLNTTQEPRSIWKKRLVAGPHCRVHTVGVDKGRQQMHLPSRLRRTLNSEPLCMYLQTERSEYEVEMQ